MYNFSPAISKATRWIRRKTSWKMIMNLEKYGTNCKENVEKSFWTLCECCRRNLRGNQIKRYSFYLLLDHSFKASSPPPFIPTLQSVYRYRGDTFLWDGFKMFQYFQAVRLQQDKEVARWLIFSVSQAARAVNEK